MAVCFCSRRYWANTKTGPMLCGVFGLLICLVTVLYLFKTLQLECDCQCSDSHSIEDGSSSVLGGHTLAVLVPFRDRFEELQEFVLHMSQFLKTQGVRHYIFGINQVDNLRFNRASLLNVGYKELPATYDYIALHDVDLLPVTQSLLYEYPASGPLHLAAPHLHPRYHYPTFIGGVLLLTREQFRLVDGLSNQYWGWGLEDDEFYARLRQAGMSIQRPGNLSTGINSFRHVHDRRTRHRDQIRCYDQHIITRRRDRMTGLSTLRYSVTSKRRMTINDAAVTVLNVALECSRQATPWCDCTHNVGNSGSTERDALLRALSTRDNIAPKIDRKKHISPDG